ITIALAYKGFISLVFGDEREKQTKAGGVTDNPGMTGKRGIRRLNLSDAQQIMITAGVMLLYLICLFILKDPHIIMETLSVNILLIFVITGFCLAVMKDGKRLKPAFVLLLIITSAEMLYNSKTAYLSLNALGDPLPEISEFKADYHDIDEVISFIKNGDNGFYRIEKDFDRAVNDPAMFDYYGLSHDSSCEKDKILNWLVNFGFCKTVYYTYYNGGSTAFVDDFFGVRYFVSRFDTIEKPYERLPYEGKYYAYFNKNALPMAYIAPAGLKDADISGGNTFEKQNLIASYWSETPIFKKAVPEIFLEGVTETGEGHYVRQADEGYIVYEIEITENEPLYFYFYAPDRQSGEVYVNDLPKDMYFTVNHWNVLCAGTFEPGEKVRIAMKIAGDSLDISEACFYYEDHKALDEWGSKAAELNEGIGEVKEITSSHLIFETDCDEDKTVMMPIPYDESWKIKCDGREIEKEPGIDVLMSFSVPGGKHVIDMKYIPKGTYAGLLISLAGIVVFAGAVIYFKKKDPSFF
ncbi:MAG: YfhO family protein, partial [Lachnospiraceae bacterium]|nr:YfhO family protein [Lachnospiraceae bacterium]